MQIRKRKKDTQIGKEEIKLSLFADDMTDSGENPKEATKKILELKNDQTCKEMQIYVRYNQKLSW